MQKFHPCERNSYKEVRYLMTESILTMECSADSWKLCDRTLWNCFLHVIELYVRIRSFCTVRDFVQKYQWKKDQEKDITDWLKNNSLE